MPDPTHPFVSCICPTYNRANFLPYLLHIFDSQEWPKNRRELIILDDSPTNNENIIKEHKKDNNIRYIHSKEKIPLGKKRNILNNLAKEKGEYIFCFDDDDYYPPSRIKNAVQKMKATKTILSGSSILYVYVTSLDKIYEFGPYGPNHCTNGTMAYYKTFLNGRSYENDAEKAEEKHFLKNYSAQMVQLEPKNVMLCISHSSNTVDKIKLLGTAKETNIKLKNFVKDKKLLDFYKSLSEESKNQEINKQQLLPPPMPEDMDENTINIDSIENGYFLVTKEMMLQEIKKFAILHIRNQLLIDLKIS